MLTSIRIQNFRSIRDAQVKLGQVNLFIGPNNSGKSNFLKGILQMASTVKEYPANSLDYNSFLELLPRTVKKHEFDKSISFLAQTDKNSKSISLLIGYNFDSQDSNLRAYDTSLVSLSNPLVQHQFTGIHNSIDEENNYRPSASVSELRILLEDTTIYKIDPILFLSSAGLSYQESVVSDGSNIVNFIYNLGQNYKSRYNKLEQDFKRCVGTLSYFSTPVDPKEPGKLKLKFFDQDDVGYWAEEVSEGVLYFLSLLCIVHQPNPPKLLLLEEPEKGIHPRRIHEVMDFIFELARLRDIQIILTSHSPYVVDHFADIPECISVFDRRGNETVIRNAATIIAETNAKLEAAGEEPIHYTDALGEYWVSGFLGGVPETITGVE